MISFILKTFLTFMALGMVQGQAYAQPTPMVVTQQTLLKNKKGLESIRQQINEQERQERLDERREYNILNRIHRVNQTLYKIQRAKINNQVDLRQSRIKTVRLRTEVYQKQEELERSRQMLAQRLRELYRLSFYHPLLGGLMDVNSFTDVARQLEFGVMLARSNEKLVEQTLQDEKRLELNSNLWRLKTDQREVIISTLNRKEIRYDREQKNHTVYLENILRQKKQREQNIQELMEAARNLQNKVSQMLAEEAKTRKRQLATYQSNVNHHEAIVAIPIPEGDGLRVIRGRIPWPVSGKIISYYGRQRDPEFHLVEDNVGIQIKAPYGTPIHAVAVGVVKFADWFKGYGKLVILDHGRGYYSLYAQAATLDVSVGQKVVAGEVIGTVGDTDSLVGNSLYFEIRKNGVPQNPLHWLKYRD